MPTANPHRSEPPRTSRTTGRRVATRPVESAVMLERRRRLRQYRLRRRDLLQDAVIAMALMVLALIITPGLGLLALYEILVALGLMMTVLVERRIRKRRLTASRAAKAVRPRQTRVRPRA